MQLISPRPYQMMHSENPKLVTWFTEECNNIIAREVKLLPEHLPRSLRICRRRPASVPRPCCRTSKSA